MSTTDPKVLDTIVKAYDVRGTVPDQLNPEIARALGAAFARFAGAPTIVSFVSVGFCLSLSFVR